MEHRLKSIQQWLKQENADAAFIQSPYNIFYLSNFLTDPHERLLGMFVFQDAEPFIICPGMEASQVAEAGWKYEVIGYGDSDEPWAMIQEAVSKRAVNVERAAIEKGQVVYARVEQLQRIFTNLTLVDAEPKLNELRLIKDERELGTLKEAAALADFGVEAGISVLKEGVTEMEVLAHIEYELKKKGVREMSFSTMVLFGTNSGLPHGNPGQNKLKRGDFVLFDLGVVHNGYCSDITRTVVFGEVSEKQKEIYETVLKAQEKSLELCRPGTRLGDLDIAAREHIEEQGYGNYFPHRIGHGLGIEVHEFPSLNDRNDDKLEEGLVFTIEPGIYVPDLGGVRIEDDLVITKNGCETLTKFPKELQIIQP